MIDTAYFFICIYLHFFSLHKTDKRQLTEDEKKTQEYDALAFRIVSYFAIPLLGAYTVYSCKHIHPISN